MQISSRFTIAIHTMLCIAAFQDKEKVTSTFIANSTHANPVVIRRILGQLKSAHLITVKAGIGGATITKPLDHITLLDLFQAVQAVPKDFFAFHDNTNANCPVGENIHNILDQYLANIQEAMNQEMKKTTLQTLFEQTKPYLK